jgi:CheY-like chemotaxis protein
MISVHPSQAHDHGNTLVLLAEDEPLIQMMMQDALEAAGYAVVAASTGAEAEAALASLPVCGLITDVRLGAAPDGWTLARHAREMNPHLPVIYATGNTAAEWPVQGVCDSVLIEKPYASEQVVSAIGALLAHEDRPALAH